MDSVERGATSLARLALIVGVTVSFIFLIVGLVFQIAAPWSARSDLLLELGIGILLCTPVLRVLVLAVGFFRRKESTFALVAFCILLLLGAGVAIGLRGE